MLKGEPLLECVTCQCLTINHILVECVEYDIFRLILFGNNVSLKDIFNNVSPNKPSQKSWIIQYFVPHLLYFKNII